VKKEQVRNRRRTRETLLCAFYACEMNETSYESFIVNENFSEWLFESAEEETKDLISDRLSLIYEDVKNLRLEKDSEISFQLPRSEAESTILYGNLEKMARNFEMWVYADKLIKQNEFTMKKEVSLSNPEEVRQAEKNFNFYKRYIELYSEHHSEIDEIVTSKIKNWDYSRIALIDKIIIRMGVVELKYFDDIPPKVTLNETIELGKKFSTPNSRVFINGILNTLKDI